MTIFEPNAELLRYILRGDAVLFVGAGASAEMGYPNWRDQAHEVAELLSIDGVEFDKNDFESLIAENKLPEAFYMLETSKGCSRAKLITALKKVTKAKSPDRDCVYSTIAKWPFSCYVTTNYDDEIAKHLSITKPKTHFVCLGNGKDDMALLGKDSANMIFKLHGSLEDLGNPVVTSIDYAKCRSGGSNAYYMEALGRLFETRNVVMIGYSLGDADIQDILEKIKLNTDPSKPVFMIAPDPKDSEIRRFDEQFNVKIIPYENSDGHHGFLARVLSLYGQFITAKPITLDPVPDADKALSLHILRRLNKGRRNIDVENYLLMNMPSSSGEYMSILSFKRSGVVERLDFREPLNHLKDMGLAEIDDEKVRRTVAGDKKIDDSLSEYRGWKKAAYDDFINGFGIALPSKDETDIRSLSEKVIETVFSLHGMAMANVVFNGEEIPGDDMVGLFQIVAQATTNINNPDWKIRFLESVKRFLTQPTVPQRKYMVGLSQGFFTYHLMCKDPYLIRAASELLSQDCWFVDSNVLQPLCAIGCPDYSMTVSLFEALKRAHVGLYTTRNVIKEVQEHLAWARSHVPNPQEFIQVENTPANTYGYNFFRHGFVREVVEGRIGSFSEYEQLLHAKNGNELDGLMDRYGINLVSADSIAQEVELAEATREIHGIRAFKNTLSNNALQVPTEAELYVVMKKMRRDAKAMKARREIFFLSTSSIFDNTEEKFRRWSRAGLYRYVRLLPENDDNDKTLLECLHSEMFNIGFSIVDEATYNRYFCSNINYAKISYAEELAQLKSDFAEESCKTEENIKAAYDATPDYRKPAFVLQLSVMRDRMDRNLLKKRTVERDVAIREAKEKSEENERLREEVARMSKLISTGVKSGGVKGHSKGNRRRKKHHLLIKAKKAMKRAGKR